MSTEEEVDALPVNPRFDTLESPDSPCAESTETQTKIQYMEILKSLEDTDCRRKEGCPETESEEMKAGGQTKVIPRSSEVNYRCVSEDVYVRQSQSERTVSSTTDKQMPPLPTKPHDDYRFNHLLLEISKHVTPDQLESFKMLFRGQSERAISKRKFEKCTTCMQFFAILSEMEYLGRNNTVYLQKLLFMMGNKELISKLIKYCQDNQTLYFFKPDEDDTDDEHSFVHLHVQGQDLSKFTPTYIREARETVAAILCIPVENVRIAGLQESDSFIITLIIPNMYVEILQTMLNNRAEFMELSDKNIDYIEINHKKFYTFVSDVDCGQTESELQDTKRTTHEKIIADKQRREAQCVDLVESLSKQVFGQKQKIDALQSELDDCRMKMHRSEDHNSSDTDVDARKADLETRNRIIGRAASPSLLSLLNAIRHKIFE